MLPATAVELVSFHKFSIAVIVVILKGIIIIIIITVMIINFAALVLIPDSVLPNYSVCFCLREFSIFSPQSQLIFL